MAAKRSAPRSPGAACEPCGPGVIQNSGGETRFGIVECGQTARRQLSFSPGYILVSLSAADRHSPGLAAASGTWLCQPELAPA
jgi:hypothetical protein